jgi:hypothetical protein
MKWAAIILSVLLMLGHLSTELASGLEYLYNGQVFYIKPFLDPNYDFPEIIGTPDGTINFYWWIKYVADDFLWVITFFVMAQVAKMYSFRIFRVACIFFAYHVFDMAMNVWNFKSYHWMYVIIYVVVGLCLIALFIPEKKQAIVKSIK